MFKRHYLFCKRQSIWSQEVSLFSFLPSQAAGVIIFEFDAGMSRPVAESINMNSIHNGLKKTQLEWGLSRS